MGMLLPVSYGVESDWWCNEGDTSHIHTSGDDPVGATNKVLQHLNAGTHTINNTAAVTTIGNGGNPISVGCVSGDVTLNILSDTNSDGCLFIGGYGYFAGGATFENLKNAADGKQITGTVNVEDGAHVVVGSSADDRVVNYAWAQLVVGHGKEGIGYLNIDGGSSVLTNSVLGVSGSEASYGEVNVTNGSTLTVKAHPNVAGTNPYALMEMSGGNNATSVLNVAHNSSFIVEGLPYLQIGKGGSNTQSTISVDDHSSLVVNGTNGYVFLGTGAGNNVSISIDVTNNSEAVFNSNVYAGYNTGTNVEVNVSGGSSFTAPTMFVGDYGNGVLNVSGAGTAATFDNLQVGNSQYAEGQVHVSDGAQIAAAQLLVGTYGNGSMTVESGAKVAAGQLYVGYDGSGTLSLTGNGSTVSTDYMELSNDSTFSISGGASHIVKEGQMVGAYTDGTHVVVGADGTLINYGTMAGLTVGENTATMQIDLQENSHFQTGTMQVTGRGVDGDDNYPLTILGYATGLAGKVSVNLPTEFSSTGTVTLGSVLEGRTSDNSGYELQKVYLGDYDAINNTLLEGLGLSEVSRENLRFEYETRHVILVLSTDEVNMHNGTHTVAVGEGSGVVIENGGFTDEATKHGTIGSFSEDGGNSTKADVRVSEAAAATPDKQSYVEWHGSSLQTIAGESTTLTEGVKVVMTDKTVEGDITTGTLLVTEGSSLTNNGVVEANTVVKSGATLKGSGTMGATEVQSGGNLVVGNSPGLQTYTGDLTLVSGSVETFSVAGTSAATAADKGWGSNTHSQIKMDDESKLNLSEGVKFIIEFGGEDMLAMAGAGPMEFELLLADGAVTLPQGFSGSMADDGRLDITDLIATTFTVTMDSAAGMGTADNMTVSISDYQYLLTVGETGYSNLVLKATATIQEVVPEPATATLSLLALAALASRRRRK